MPSAEQISAAYGQTQAVYERQAAGWDARRPKMLIEQSWLEAFAARVPQGGRVLDLGCGAGDPIAGWFLQRGYDYTGIDYSQPMLDIARQKYPAGTWLRQDMRALSLEEVFDGVLSWDGSFHLSIEEQRKLIMTLGKVVGQNGVLMLTIGHEEGEVLGTVEGEAVYHASLSEEDYKHTLKEAGFTDMSFTLQDEACDMHSILMAWR
jgi:SAM-dependent methyltransferase